jgi:tRNA A37 threonylcarbamoyladenosine biosynthesis protein TsaE
MYVNHYSPTARTVQGPKGMLHQLSVASKTWTLLREYQKARIMVVLYDEYSFASVSRIIILITLAAVKESIDSPNRRHEMKSSRRNCI